MTRRHDATTARRSATGPGTWYALAVAFAAISTTSWVQALRDGEALAFLPAVAFVLAGLALVVQGRREARARARR